MHHGCQCNARKKPCHYSLDVTWNSAGEEAETGRRLGHVKGEMMIVRSCKILMEEWVKTNKKYIKHGWIKSDLSTTLANMFSFSEVKGG